MTLGVLFGGPTPEHDISILTGLLALRELDRGERDVTGIYWTKTGAFYAVPNDVEAESFLDGLPKGASELTLRLGDQGGFYASARMGKDRALAIEALVLATHGGPGEDGTLQGALDLAGVAYSGPTRRGRGAGHGQVGLRRPDGVGRNRDAPAGPAGGDHDDDATLTDPIS